MTRRHLDRDVLLAEPPRRKESMRAARALIDELPGGRRSVLGLVTLTLLEVGVQVVVVLAARQVLSVATAPGSDFPTRPSVVAVVAAILTFAVVRWRHRVQERLAIAGRERAVRRLAAHLHRSPVADLSATPMAGLREVLMTDVDFAYRFLLDSSARLSILLAWLVAAVAVTAWLSPTLLFVLVVLGVIVTAAMLRATRAHLALTAPRFLRLSAASQRARDVVEVERVVMSRQFGLADLFVDRFVDSHEDFTAVAHRQGMVTASIRAWLSSLGAATFLAVVLTGGALVLGEQLSLGSLVVVLFVLAQLLAALTALGDFGAKLAETATAGTRLMAFWDDVDGRPPDRPRRPGDALTAVRARGLGYAYPGGPAILHGVDVDLARGEPVALTGATGAGKSTLALLLTGILRPDTGRVCVVAEDGSRDDPADVAAGRLLYVGSKPVLVAGSIRDNLLLHPDEQQPSAADLAGFVAEVTAGALPFGIDEPVVGPNGTGLSSGQAQLVQLARAVHRDPDVIVLDEATSALDIETERAVQQALSSWCRQRVSLVVSHRTCPWTETATAHLRLAPVPGSTSLTVTQVIGTA